MQIRVKTGGGSYIVYITSRRRNVRLGSLQVDTSHTGGSVQTRATLLYSMVERRRGV